MRLVFNRCKLFTRIPLDRLLRGLRFTFFWLAVSIAAGAFGAHCILRCRFPQFKLISTEPLTLHCNKGRLGNQMCSYATLHGIARLNNRTFSVMPCNYEFLKQYFDLDTNVVDLNSFRPIHAHKIGPFLRVRDTVIEEKTNFINGYLYPCSFTFFHHLRQDIRKIFRFKEGIEEFSQKVLRDMKGRKRRATFIGVHVRRTDFLTPTKYKKAWLKAYEGKEVNIEYFEEAVQYLKQKYRDAVFVAVSDDREWCRQHLIPLGIDVAEESPSAAHDLAILANCNHTIMTYGSYGFWGGYLAGGDVVYFDKFLKPNTEFTEKLFLYDKMYLPEWIGLAT